MSALGYVFGLAAVWVLLWGTASPANVLAGLVVGTVLVLLLPGLRIDGRRAVVRPRAAASFLWTVLVDMVHSNVRLTKTILSGRRDVESSIIEIDIPICSDQLLTTIANLLAVVPGTMPLEVHGSPRRLVVHVLHLDPVAESRAAMEDLVAKSVAAFGEVAAEPDDVEPEARETGP
jgi:multicomponent Na+:H+ antiporter subunit E